MLGVKLRKPSGAVRSAGLVLTTPCTVLLTPPIRPTKDQHPSFIPVMLTKSLSVCGLYCLKRMDVLMWKSSMASWILCLSRASVQETGLCQFLTECFAPPKTLKVPLCSLGNTKPGQKVPGLIIVGAVRRYSSAQGRTLNRRFYLGATRRLHDAVRRNGQEMAMCCVANDNVPLHLAERLQPMFAKQHIQQVLQPQNSNSRLYAGFFMFPGLRTP